MKQPIWPTGRNDSPFSGSQKWLVLLMLLVTAVTGVKATIDHNPWQDYDSHCPFWAEHYGLDPILFNYDEAEGSYYIEWMIALLDDDGDDELFRVDKGVHGLRTYIKVGDQEEVCYYELRIFIAWHELEYKLFCGTRRNHNGSLHLWPDQRYAH